MILFMEDWERFPGAFLDYESPNISFLKFSLLLKEMGVKNYNWPLCTIYPELRGVDPFDPSLSTDLKILVASECKVNPWYYLRNVARIPGSTVDNPIRFEANRSNMSVMWLFFNHITICLVQPRQTGKTFTVSTLDNYLLNVRSEGGRTLMVTKSEDLRAKTLTEIRVLEEMLPPYLKVHHKTDIGNREEINVSALDNNYKAFIARNDPIAADKTGRGHTVENVRVDEAAYLFWIEILMKTLMPATTAARRLAILRDNPYSSIFTTTAGKKDERDGKYMHSYFQNGAPWTEFLYDSQNEDMLKAAVRSSSRDGKYLRVFMQFNHRQLGYTDQWLEETARETGSTGEAFERDFLNIWTSGSQYSPFSTDTSKKIRESEKDAQFAEISIYGQIVTRWYLKEDKIKPFMANEHTIMSVDTSDAMGRDEFSIQILSLKTGQQLASCGVNEINLITVAHFLVDLLVRFPKMTLIIERRNQAATIVDFMHKQLIAVGIDPFRRMYNLCVQEHLEYQERYKEIQNPRNHSNEGFLAQFKRFFGFVTSGSGTNSRGELYGNTLQQAVKYIGTAIYDKQTIDQLLSLVVINGRVDHPAGGHDDLVISWLLAAWFMLHGKNLQYYGIPAGYVLSQNTVLTSSSTREEMIQNEQTRRAKEHIERMIELIKVEKDPYVVERMLFEIEHVKSFLGPHHEVSVATDNMINEIKNSKRSQMQVRRPIFQ